MTRTAIDSNPNRSGHIARSIVCQTCLFCLFATGQVLADGSGAPPEVTDALAQEVMDKLHPGIAPMDETVWQDLADLAKRGAELYPAVIYILQSSKDPMVVGALMSVVLQMEDDRTPLLPELRNLCGREEAWARRICAEMLGRIGEKSDLELLFQLMRDDEERVRIAAASAAARLGGPENAPEARRVLRQRFRGMSKDDIERDGSIKFIQSAIDKLEAMEGRSVGPEESR